MPNLLVTVIESYASLYVWRSMKENNWTILSDFIFGRADVARTVAGIKCELRKSLELKEIVIVDLK